MGRKTPPFPEHPDWTTSRFWTFVRSALRKAWQKWPPKYTAKNATRRKYDGPDKRTKWEYQCNICKKWFKGKETEVDHIIDPGSLKCYEDLPGFVTRLFVGVDKLQVLCKPCHKGKK